MDKYLFFVSMFLLGLVAVGFIVGLIDKSELVDCLKWQKQAEEYRVSGFYLLQWQADQCKAHNIIINAEVRSTDTH